MFVTAAALSYAFLGIGVLAALFFIYFTVLVVKTSPDNSDSRAAIIGDMREPDTWRSRNNSMAYLSLFWAIVSAAIFIYFKYYYKDQILSIVIPFIYVGLIAISASYLSSRKKHTAH